MSATTAHQLAGANPRRHIAVIPCRWGASRFPGKPLAPLGGKPLLWHVHQRCLEANRLDRSIVATDDERIEAACGQLGIDCIRTGEHLTGTDRVAEVAERLPAGAYINVQGDEPFISPTAIDDISEALEYAPPGTLAVNAYTELHDLGAALDHNVVKVVVSAEGKALMFSRQPIPYPKGDRPKYLRQLGLYGFTGPALRHFLQLQQGPLERAEGVEMLRFIEHGHAVHMVPVVDDGVAVDTPDDLARAERLFNLYNGAVPTRRHRKALHIHVTQSPTHRAWIPMGGVPGRRRRPCRPGTR